MSERIREIASRIRESAGSLFGNVGKVGGNAAVGVGRGLYGSRRSLIALAVAGLGIYAAVSHPPMQNVGRGELGLRINRFSGEVTEAGDGAILVLPGLHELRRFSLRDHTYRPTAGQSASGPSPFQSVEGLSIGVDVSVRYVLDRNRITSMARSLPADIGAEVIEPAAQSVLYKAFASHTVREIYSSKRAAIQAVIEAELKPMLARDGITLQGVMIGKIDLPADYKRGMESLLAEEIATEKMRYTLELKDKHVKQTELEAQAELVRREKAAEAAGQEQVIAAKAQAEAMKHVLPFKQKQIEQRQLEAEAAKISRVKAAEAESQARQIEATGEAESRRKLADAEGYRTEQMGKLASQQLARDGETLTRHPLLIQKTMADKLSDKISVIIAPPSTNGGFIGANLLGGEKQKREEE